jgi:3-hydroxyacyl-[acyl-carrier-protein] dehydratase
MTDNDVCAICRRLIGVALPDEAFIGSSGIPAALETELAEDAIRALIPERPPGLYVTRAVIYRLGSELRIVAPFAVTAAMCDGHMPEFPVLPLAVAGRALAQLGAVLIAHLARSSMPTRRPTPLVHKVGAVNSRHRNYLVPGTVLTLFAEGRQLRGPLFRAQTRGFLEEREIFTMTDVEYIVSDDPRLWGDITGERAKDQRP